MVLLSLILSLVGCGGGGSSAEPAPKSATPTVSAQDCSILGSVVSDISVGARADELVPIAVDIAASDYLVDRDFLNEYAVRAPEDVGAEVVLLSRWVDRYAEAAEAAGVEPGATPTQDEVVEIRLASNLSSDEQGKLPEAIRILGVWTANGCSGGRPPSETTSTVTTSTSTTGVHTSPVADASADAAVGDSVDEVTAAVNEVMSQQTERELGSPPLGSEVRNCRKEREFSANSLLAPGGAAYFCEVWFEGERRDDGAAIIDVDGNVFSTP